MGEATSMQHCPFLFFSSLFLSLLISLLLPLSSLRLADGRRALQRPCAPRHARAPKGLPRRGSLARTGRASVLERPRELAYTRIPATAEATVLGARRRVQLSAWPEELIVHVPPLLLLLGVYWPAIGVWSDLSNSAGCH
jgi:hypothetical protein